MYLLRAWHREPLLPFLILGTLAFGIDVLLAAPEPKTLAEAQGQIKLKPSVRARVQAEFKQKRGRLPSAQEEREGLQAWLDEEMLYRHALKLGLDRDDIIVRRRLVQKMRFLIEDLEAPAPPSNQQLKSWMEADPERYQRPLKLSFEQVFLSRSKHKERLEKKGSTLLKRLQQGEAPEALGDPFFNGRRFQEKSEQEISAIFGRGLARALVASETLGRWLDPFKSSFGLHLIRIEARQPPRLAKLSELRKRVSRDYKKHQRRQANEKALEALRREYRVEGL